MSSYLVQHGKSLSKDVDPEKGLSDEGMAEVERIANVAKGYGIPVKAIMHSGKKRALQTAEIFAAALNPPEGLEKIDGINPLDNVAVFSETLEGRISQMLVGHLPFMEKLTSYLIAGSIDKPVFKFQNGGIVCLDKHPDTQTWVIKWTLMPNIG
ncbi:phosphohistidine phosphatase SixA [Thermodesulfobacteriota bacterium]